MLRRNSSPDYRMLSRPLASATARTARRRTADLFTNGVRPVTLQPPSAVNPPPSTAPGDKISTFCKVVTDFSKRLPSSAPKIGARPLRSCPSSFNSLMTAFARLGEADEVLRLFNELKHSDPSPNALCYNTVINSLVVANRPEEAEAVFEEMIASGVAPTVASYTILVKMLSFHPKTIHLAYGVIRGMVRHGCYPDSITYSVLIAGLCQAGRIEEAWGVLDQMLEEKCPPTVNAYTCIVHGYCSQGRIDEAKRLVGMMGDIGCPPDTVTYSILIEALCKFGEFGEVEKVLGESASKGWKPNAITYNIYMNGLCRYDKVDEAFSQVEVMRSSGLIPDMMTLNILFDCLCRDSKIREAKCLLERSFELDWDVDVVFYNTLMSRLCELGEWLPVLKIMTDMVKKGILPDACSFTIVIRSLCKIGKLRKAKCIISSRGFVPDVVAFNTLLDEFYMARASNEARLLFAYMVAENIAPNKLTYAIMIDSLCNEGDFLGAIDCFIISLKDGFLPALVTRLAKWLVRSGKLRELLKLFEEILGRGLVLHVLTFNSLVKTFCKEGFCQSVEFYKVCLILDKMLGIR